MQSAYHANRLHDLFIVLIQLAFLAKKKLPYPVLCVLVTGLALFAGISKFIQGELSPGQIDQ